jgi:amino acid adenylation domain-containing protein
MTALDLLTRLRGLDVQLRLDGEQLRFSAPRGALTPELRQQLAARKREVVDLLRGAAGPGEETCPIVPVPRGGELPLSFSQLRQWFLVEFDPDSPAYDLPEAVALEGPLRVAELARSLGEIVRRHEALRTTFAARGGTPHQVIGPPRRPPLPLVDLQGLPPAARQETARRLARRHAEWVFDLRRGPLLKALLVRRGPAEHWFLLNLHHIVFDRWSMGVFIREMEVLYAAFAAGRPSPLPAPRLHYADFAAWQRGRLQGEVLAGLLDYWRQRLAAAPALLPLPLDRPRPAVRTHRGGRRRVALPPALTRSLQELGSRRGATLFMVLVAALQALLARYTGQRDLALGTFIANRNRPEVEDLIGFFVNTLVLRTDLGGDPSFDEVLRRVQEVTLGAYAHQDLPFEKLLEELSPGRDMSHSPFFQVMLVLQNTPAPALRLPGLAVRRLDLEAAAWVHFDWTLWLWQEGAGLAGDLDYNHDLFDAATMERLLGHFAALLAAAAARPGERLSRLQLAAPAEAHQLLREWNDRRRPPPPPGGVPALFAARVAAGRDAVALVGDDEQLSYGELERRSGLLADLLRRLGAGPEVTIGLFFDRSPALVVALLAVLTAGAAYVPVEANAPRERAAELLAAAGVSVLISRGALRGSLPPVAAPTVDADQVAARPGAATRPPAPAPPGALAYVLFTSGSTGRPKGVMVAAAGLASAALGWGEAYDLGPGVRQLQVASCSFDVATAEIVRSLASGGRLVLCPLEVLLAPERLAAFLAARAIDVVELVPAVFRPLLSHLAKAREVAPLPRLWVVGSEVWYARELAAARALLPPATRVINSYGVTEATVDASLFEGGAPGADPQAAVPIGRPYANVAMHVVDRTLAAAPLGVVGELVLGGAGVARGYLGRPGRTAERFVPDPLGGGFGARLYRTGDRARRLAAGDVEFLGRADDQVKIRGFRVEPGEIEAVLGRHPGVAAAAVVPREAGGERRLVAYVVPAGGEVTAGELRGWLGQRLPGHMVPAAFHSLPALPLGASGKVDRRRLPAPEWSRPEGGKAFRTPANAVEEVLAEVFGAVLGIERVGADDNFFELGGHSLLVTRVVAQLADSLHVEVPVRAIFEAPTVAELAMRVEEAVLAKIEELSEEEVAALL